MAQTMTREALKAKLDRGDRFKLVNVLSRESFERAHIRGSINLPLPELAENAERFLDKNEEIVVYCASFDCAASPTAAKLLRQMGFTNVIDFEGGMADWKDAGYPVKSGPAEAPAAKAA